MFTQWLIGPDRCEAGKAKEFADWLLDLVQDGIHKSIESNYCEFSTQLPQFK